MWKNININKNLIKTDTGRAVLIALPHNSKYDGYSFWHPSKLVRNGKHSAAVSIGYTDDFTFNLKKYGKGRYNSSDVIDELQLSAGDMEAVFGVVGENINAPVYKNPYETRKPAELTPEAVTADESLIDDE